MPPIFTVGCPRPFEAASMYGKPSAAATSHALKPGTCPQITPAGGASSNAIRRRAESKQSRGATSGLANPGAPTAVAVMTVLSGGSSSRLTKSTPPRSSAMRPCTR